MIDSSGGAKIFLPMTALDLTKSIQGAVSPEQSGRGLKPLTI
jgi:hypothetical protein